MKTVTRTIMERAARIAACLMLVMLSIFTAGAEEFITEVKLIGGTSTEVKNLKSTLTADGWTFIDYDLNKGASGDYIYLLYKTKDNLDGLDHHYITDFYISNATGTIPDTKTFNERDYNLVPFDGGNNFKDSKGDLNRGAGGATIHLYYTTDQFDNSHAVSSIEFNNTESGAVVWNGDGNEAADLNKGAGGDYIYMHFITADASLGFLTDVMLIGGSKTETDELWNTLKNDNWKKIDYDLNKGAGGDYIYLLYKSEKNTDGVNRCYINGFCIRKPTSGLTPDEFNDRYTTYYRVPYDGSDGFKESRGDLNHGAPGNTTIHLYYTRDYYFRNGPNTALTGIYFNDVRDDGVGTLSDWRTENGITCWLGYNLNEGCTKANAETIYMHFSYKSIYSQTLSGKGTTDSPFLIRGSGEWATFAENVARDLDSDKCYLLSNSITTNVMVGNGDHPFTGTFKGKAFATLTWEGSTINETGAAPFHAIKGATIENLNVNGSIISDAYHASGLVGYAQSGATSTLRNCVVTASVTCNGYGGGLVGHGGSGSTLILDNCAFSGELKGFNGYAGGLVGWCSNLTLTINNCLVGCSFTPSDGGKYHPFACKNASSSVTATGTNNYCLNTCEEATATGDYIIPYIDYTPISKESDDYWNERFTGIDGRSYYKYSQAVAAYSHADFILDEVFYSPDVPTGWDFHSEREVCWQLLPGDGYYGCESLHGKRHSAFITNSDPDHRYDADIRAKADNVGLCAPPINLSECGHAYLEYYYFFKQPPVKDCPTSAYRTMTLRVCYQNSSDGDWITLKEYNGFTENAKWEKEEAIELPNLSNVYRIGFFYSTEDSKDAPIDYEYWVDWEDNHIVAIDNVSIYCMNRPTDLVLCPKSATSIELNWSAATSAVSTWQICVDNDEEHLITVNQCSHTINNLNLTQSHTFKVRSFDDQNQDHSRWSESATWTYNTYSISYELNGGTVTTANPTEYTNLSDDFTLTNPTRDGGIFKDWTGTGLTEPATTVTIPIGSTGNRTYTANWTLIEYDITYENLQGASNENPTTYNVESGTIYLNAPTRDGYLFMGWTGTDLNGSSQVVIIPAGSTGDRTYTAAWQEIQEWTGSGTEASPYLIKSCGDLNLLAYRVNGTHGQSPESYSDTYFKLDNDIKYATSTNWDDANSTENNFEGIGNHQRPFKGIIDGNGYTVRGLRIYKEGLSDVGLVGLLGVGGIIKDLTIADARITGRTFVGGIAGDSDEGSNGFIMNCHVAADVSIHTEIDRRYGVSNVFGGIVGYASCPIIGCVSEASLSTGGDNTNIDASAGGIAGESVNYIINCFVIGAVVPSLYQSGAIAGWQYPDDNDPQANNYYTACTVNGNANATNVGCGEHCYYSDSDRDIINNYGDLDGYRLAHTITLTDPRISIAGPRTVYNVSGLTAIGTTAMIYDSGTASTIYSGKGQTITLNVTPEENRDVTVTYNGITITPVNGVYSFTMPDEDVTVTYISLKLPDDENNSGTINNYNNETFAAVQLQGRTLWKDGAWNTLCLPFNLTSFTGTPLEGATVKTLTSSDFANGTLTMNFSDDLTSIEAGKPYIVKYDADLVISTAADWNTFAANVNNGTESYEGKTVKLADNIDVTTMVGNNSHPFKGTFDGCGNTLNVNLSGGGDGISLFYKIIGATIQNVKVTGSITSSYQRPATFASFVEGNSTIRNCWSNVDIVSTGTSWVDAGGMVARVTSGGTINITDCTFTGTVTYTNSNYEGGGMVGWTQANSTANLTRCLYMPSVLTMGTSNDKTYIFVSGEVRGNLTNCYYNSVANGASQLKKEGTYTTATGNDLQALLGFGWEVSGSNVVPKMLDTASDIVNPVFTNVTVSNTTANVSTQYVNFIGTYDPITFNSTSKSVLFLGGNNTLYYPQAGTNIGAFRAYFQLNGIEVGTPNGVKEFKLSFGDEDSADGIENVQCSMFNVQCNDAWYDLSGRRLGGKPTQKGIYINNGIKVAIK